MLVWKNWEFDVLEIKKQISDFNETYNVKCINNTSFMHFIVLFF